MEASVTLSLDNGPFSQGLQRAEQQANAFAGKMRGLGDRVQGLFRRTPHARAEAALAGFAGNLASGNIQGAILGVTERMKGLGLAAGIGIGAAIIVFEKAKEQINAVQKATENLNKELARPLSLQSALGAEGIGKEIDKTAEKLDTLREKRQSFFAKFFSYLQTPQQGSVFKRGGNQYQTQLGILNTEKWNSAQEAGEKRLRDLTMARANAELDVANVKRTAVNGSEREVLWLKTSLDYNQKIAEIQLESGLTKPGRSADVLLRRMTAAKIAEEAEFKAGSRQLDLRQLQAETEGRILELHNSTLSKDQQSLLALKERINLLKQERSLTNDPVKKKVITNQIVSAQNNVRDAQFDAADMSPQAVAARNAAKLQALQREAFDTRMNQMEDPNRKSYGAIVSGLGAVGPQKPPPIDDLADLSKHMSPFAGSPGFEKVFGGATSQPQGTGTATLGTPGVLDRIEKAVQGIGANR